MAEAKQGLLSKQAVDNFLDKWLNDPAFPDRLKSDPKAALEGCGILPSEDMLRSLEDVGPSTSVEELRRRISKGMSWN